MSDDKPVFAIIGESGSGKTCAMCGSAMELSRDYPVLFYRAANLTEGIIKSIANDFNWEFSAQSVTQIFEHLRKEVPREDVQKIVYALFKEGAIEKEGPKAKTVYFMAIKK